MKQPSRDTVATHPPRLYLLPSLAPPRRTLSPRLGYAVAALVVGLGLFASVTPSPLYRSYSVLWHFSPLTLTLIYATYAFGVLASLLLAGGVSDDVGRRPVLLVALGALMASSVLFMVAGSAAWLFVARGLQGLATGAALSAASAALLDLHPKRDPAGVGLTTATAAPSGIGLGVLVSSCSSSSGLCPASCPTSCCSSSSRSPLPAPTGCRSRSRSVAASASRPSAHASRPSAPPVLPGRAGRALLMVDRRPLLLARPATRSPSLQLEQRDRLRQRHRRTRRCGCRAQLLTARSAPWIGASVGSIALAAGMVLIVFRCRPRLERRLPGRLDPRRRRLRRRLPRRPPRARRSDPASAPRGSHVRLLRRRLHLPLAAGRPRRHRRRTRRAAHDLRALRQRRRGDRPDRRLRSLAHPSQPRSSLPSR